MQWTKISEIHLLKGSIRLVFLVRWNREFDQFSFLSYNTNEEFPNFANFDLLSIGRVSRRKKLRNNVLGHERAFSNVPGGRAPATRIFAFRGERVFPTFFFSPLSLFFFINSRSLGLSIFGINCLEKRRPGEGPPPSYPLLALSKCPDDFSSAQFPPVPHRSRHE